MTIIKQGNIYHAELKVPKDVQGCVGKKKFRKSLKTTNIKVAKRKEPLIIAGWKEKIEVARGNGGDIQYYAQQYRDADDEGKEILEHIYQDMVIGEHGKFFHEELSEKDKQKAIYKYKLITGQKIITNIKLNQWLSQWDVNQKSREQGGRYVTEFCERFLSTDQVNKKNLSIWCNELIFDKGLSKKTITCRLSPCKSYWEYLQIKGYVDPDKNPFINLKIPGNKRMMLSKESREEFSVEEINKLQVEIKKKSNIYPELNHLFQIAIYTGARIEEICKISKDDIKSEVIKIANSKTQAGIREVPIHDKLISLIKELHSSSSGEYLIDNLVPNKFGQRSAYIGKRFGRLKKRLGFGSTKVFHSIRKTVITQFEQAGVPESVTADIVGHDKKTMTYGLYSGGSSLKQKLEAINKIKY